MTAKVRTVKLTTPEFGATPPPTPQGTTRWEQQELTRLWDNTLHHLRDAILRAADLHEHVRTTTAPSRSAAWNNAAGDLAAAAEAFGGYAALCDAIQHRLALEVKASG